MYAYMNALKNNRKGNIQSGALGQVHKGDTQVHVKALPRASPSFYAGNS